MFRIFNALSYVKKIWRKIRLLHISHHVSYLSANKAKYVSLIFVSMCLCLLKKLHYLLCNQISKHPCYFILVYTDFPFHMLLVAFPSFCYVPRVILRLAYPKSNISTRYSSSSNFIEIKIRIRCMKFSIIAKKSKSLSKVLKYIIMFKLLENFPDFSESIIGLLNIINQ